MKWLNTSVLLKMEMELHIDISLFSHMIENKSFRIMQYILHLSLTGTNND